MKDFAKSIYVGNAKDKNGKELRIGDIVLVWTSAGERAGKVKAISGERITVEIRNEGDWSTPGKLADKVSNKKTGNADVVKDGSKWVVMYAEGTKSKEFDSKEAADKFAKEVGNTKIGNASTFDRLDDAVHYASNLTDDALRRLNGTFSATNLISALSKCKQACDDAIKLAQQYDREINKGAKR